MGMFDVFRRTVELAEAQAAAAPSTAVVPLAEHAAVVDQLELVSESILGLEELALEDRGWARMIAEAPYQFSRLGLIRITAMCRVMAIKNPLIKRGLGLRANYVFGQGVTLAARAAADAPQDVNAVVQAWWDHPDTQRVLSGAQAQAERERDLGTDGNVYIAAVTDRLTGRVTLRLIPSAQILDTISNPDDIGDVWFIRREWSVNRINLGTGAVEQQLAAVWHPAIGYQPPAAQRPPMIGGYEVRWGEPILHAAVNRPSESVFGVPDAYAAVDWARAYSDFLTDWAKLMRALARFAWKAKTTGANAAKLRAALNRPVLDPITGQSDGRGAGQAAVMDPATELEAVNKTGATFDADSGKPLATMVSAALDLPVTMLLGDPGVTGAQAVAATLDKPFDLSMQARQGLWAAWIRQLVDHVIDSAVIAPRGPLRGVVTQDGHRRVVTLAGDVERTVEITFPPLDEQSPAERIAAIVAADSTGHLLPRTVVSLLLQALGVDDVDEVLDEMTDGDGNFIDPAVQAAAVAMARERNGAPGSQAAEAYA